MKKIFLFIAAIFAAIGLHAQEKQIPKVETTLADLKAMLELEGYETYSFDLTSLLNGRYKISVIAKEYVDGQVVYEEELFASENKTMISWFSEEDQKEVIAKGSADDPEHDIYRQTDRIQIAFSPIDQQVKKRNALISLNNMVGRKRTFDLKTVTGGDKEFCNYYAKPFENHPLTESEFHPLVLLGSVWYDSQYNIFRFCGENEIAPDLSSKILKYTPHYFVIGIKVQKINNLK